MTSTSTSTTTRPPRHLTARDASGAIVLGIACAITYVVMAVLIGPLVHEAHDTDEIGGMWAVVATVFVFRASETEALRNAWTRLAATTLSLAVCTVYLVLFAVTPVGIGVVIAVGALLALLIGAPQDAALTGITSIVVLVVADLGRPDQRWLEPLLRLFDTAVGIGVGLLFATALALLARRWHRLPAGS
jgi:uncharacterized membrane protein YccC